jgi:tripeptide aminopeptidase
LEAIEAIKEQNHPHRPLELLFTVAEEVIFKRGQLFDTSKIKASEAYIRDGRPRGTVRL